MGKFLILLEHLRFYTYNTDQLVCNGSQMKLFAKGSST